ncbi:Pentatricopeptide repeat [Dillenia turbinata]|uniref:Pentatricopeptide repeat n=1 Tax=Dillenia turbinata TaxID=194707 RepID=A0AAN8UUZ7_9MAGN
MLSPSPAFRLLTLPARSSLSSSLSIPLPTHQHIAHLILDQKSAADALHTFRWASSTFPNFTHDHSTYRALIHKLCTFRSFDSVAHLLDEMPTTIGSPPDETIFLTIVRGLGRAKMIRLVIRVPELISKFRPNHPPSLKIFNSILDVLVQHDIDIAREFYRKKMMGCGVQGDDYTYGTLMKGLCLTNRIADAFKLLQLMKSRGFTPNTVVYNTLIHALCKNGKVGRGRSLMCEMGEPNGVTFNILISGYCQERNLVQALVLLDKSFNLGYVPDIVTVTKVVHILCTEDRIMDAVEILERVEQKGGAVDILAYNTLIKGFCKLGKTKIGHRFLKKMEKKGCLPNVDTYNALIAGFCESGMSDSALDLFNEMKAVGINCNFVTYDTMIKGLCSAARVEDGLKILELMEESKGGSRGHISPYNSIIYGLYKTSRSDEALVFLTKMGKLFPEAVDRSLRIIGLSKDGRVDEAKGIYDMMVGEGRNPSTLVYVTLIYGFCQDQRTKEAFELMNEMVGHGYFPVASTFNVIVKGLCRQGRIRSAFVLLEDMVRRGCSPDIESYGPLIDACCQKGDFEKSAMLLTQMVERGISPNYLTWRSLLSCLCPQAMGLYRNNYFA